MHLTLLIIYFCRARFCSFSSFAVMCKQASATQIWKLLSHLRWWQINGSEPKCKGGVQTGSWACIFTFFPLETARLPPFVRCGCWCSYDCCAILDVWRPSVCKEEVLWQKLQASPVVHFPSHTSLLHLVKPSKLCTCYQFSSCSCLQLGPLAPLGWTTPHYPPFKFKLICLSCSTGHFLTLSMILKVSTCASNWNRTALL